MAPPTAYRVGIVHFRALYSFLRLLPAYRLFRRLRRQNNGLRLGIKLWAPDGYTDSEAWDVIERDLVGINAPLDDLSSPAGTGAEVERYAFAPLHLFGSMYELAVKYRPNVDFEVEDLESVLSERFVDMDEEWFTPTVRQRASGSNTPSRSASRAEQTSQPPSRRTSIVAGTPGSLGAGKWNAMAEGLPFAFKSGDEPPSPQAAIPAYRRLSAHSLQPFQSISASPTASVLRGTPSSARAIPSGAGGQAMARTSSFLSQSGRSQSHAQMARDTVQVHQGTPPLGPPIGVSPPTPIPTSPASPVKRASIALASSSPFVGGSLERDSPLRRGSIGRSPTLRRTGTRRSQEGDSDEIHAFLRALDSWTPPASLGGAAGSSGSAAGSSGAAGSLGSVERDRVPLTRTHVDDMLKRMAGSFATPGPSSNPSSRRSSLSGPRGPGLLSASRPISTASSPAPTRGISTLTTNTPPTDDEHGLTRTATVPVQAKEKPNVGGEARSLPSETPLKKGPMVVRGGFGALKVGNKCSSPSHSPVRERKLERELPRGVGGVTDRAGAPHAAAAAGPHTPHAAGAGAGTGGTGGSAAGGAAGAGEKGERGGAGEEVRPGIQRIRSSVAAGRSISRSAGSQQSPVFEGLMAKLAQSKLDAAERERRTE